MTTLVTRIRPILLIFVGLFPIPRPTTAAPAAEGPAAVDSAAVFRAECERRAAMGTSLVIPGLEGWLFLRSELRHVGVGQFWGAAAARVSRAVTPDKADPLPAIVDFHAQLQAREIELLLLPVPCKAVIYADQVVSPVGHERLDVVHREFYRELATRGIGVLDVTEHFLQERARGARLFCQTDSHWSPLACQMTAQLVKRHIGERAWLPARPLDLQITNETRTIMGDLSDGRGSEELPARTLSSAVHELLEDKSSPILLLGDSHTLVYHAGQDLHGGRAGLADQLACELGLLVDVIGVRGSGATPARVNLLRRNKATPGYLAGKRLVIWCFAAREFTESTGWSRVPLGPPSRPQSIGR